MPSLPSGKIAGEPHHLTLQLGLCVTISAADTSEVTRQNTGAGCRYRYRYRCCCMATIQQHVDMLTNTELPAAMRVNANNIHLF